MRVANGKNMANQGRKKESALRVLGLIVSDKTSTVIKYQYLLIIKIKPNLNFRI